MDLSGLHQAVRATVRSDFSGAQAAPVSSSERRAVSNLHRRLQRAGGELKRVVAPNVPPYWF